MLGCVVLAAVRAGIRLCLGRLPGEAGFPLVLLRAFCSSSILFAVCFVFASIVVPITPPPGNYELEGGISV